MSLVSLFLTQAKQNITSVSEVTDEEKNSRLGWREKIVFLISQ